MNMEEAPMTCDDVVSGELVAKYVVDELTEETREAFEQHYFDCRRCFDLLQTYRAMQAELARTRELAATEATRASWVWRWSWAPALAVLFITVSVGLWLRPLSEVPGSSTTQTPPSTTITPGPPETPTTSLPAPGPSLADLARVDPPAYVASRLRGADEATVRFNEAMAHYQRRNWGAAIGGLRAAVKLDPEAPHIAFFLGVSHLLTGQPDLAIDELKRTIALGESPYLEEAHFYLAKAHLQTQHIDDAIKELEQTVRLGGGREADARQLLGSIAQLARPTK